jgi:hypothetical protein
MKLLLTTSKINIKGDFEDKDLLLIPKIGIQTINFIKMNKNSENLEKLLSEYVGENNFEILKEYIEIKVDEINETEQTKKRKNFQEIDEKNKKIKLNDN